MGFAVGFGVFCAQNLFFRAAGRLLPGGRQDGSGQGIAACRSFKGALFGKENVRFLIRRGNFIILKVGKVPSF